MKRIKFVAIFVLLGIICLGADRGRYSGQRKPGITVTVAASNSTAKAKANADFVCDGTDDQVQIQAALDELSFTSFGTGTLTFSKVILSSGDFYIASGIEMRNGSQLVGAGYRTTFLIQAANNINLIQSTDTGTSRFFIVIRDLGLRGFGGLLSPGHEFTQGTGISLFSAESPDGTIERVWADDFADDGIKVGNWNWQINNTKVERCGNIGINGGSEILNCHAIYNQNGIRTVNDTRMTNCFIFKNEAKGLTIAGSNSIISSCQIKQNNYGDGSPADLFVPEINIDSGSINTQILGCNIDASHFDGGDTFRKANAIKTLAGDNSVIIRNCIIKGYSTLAVRSAKNSPVNMWDNKFDRFIDLLAVSATLIVNAENISGGDVPVATIAAQPDDPRNVTLTVTDGDAGISAFSIAVTGLNAFGHEATETFVFGGGLVQAGNIAFTSVTEVAITGLTGEGAGDTVSIGIGTKLGLSDRVFEDVTFVDNRPDVYQVKRENAVVAAGNYTVDTTYSTVDVASEGITGGDTYEIRYRHNQNTVKIGD